MLSVSLTAVPWNMFPWTRVYTNRFWSCVATFIVTRCTAGFGVTSAADCPYEAMFAQSLKSPSMRMIEEGAFGPGESMLARIGTMIMSATTAAIPITERDQCGWDGILGVPCRPRRPFVNPFPLTRPFVAPRPNVRPFTAPVVSPFTRPSASPLTRPFVRPFVRPLRVPFTRPFVRPAPVGPGVASPFECRPEDVLDLQPVPILSRGIQLRRLCEGFGRLLRAAQFVEDFRPVRPGPFEGGIRFQKSVVVFELLRKSVRL